MIFTAVIVFLAGFADRVRGAGDLFPTKWGNSGEVPGALLTGLLLYLLFPMPEWAIVAYAVAWKAGEALGWSEIVGAPCRGELKMDQTRLETWMVGPLKYWWPAAIVRGLIWAVPMAIPTYFIDPTLVVPMLIAYTASFPLSSLVVMRFTSGDAVWSWTEWARGWITFAILIALTV